MVGITVAAPSKFTKVREFYESVNYDDDVFSENLFIIAEEQDRIIGAVRLCQEGGLTILRGFNVAKSYQRQGIGSKMLNLLVDQVGSQDCYCITYAHLIDFFRRVGFEPIHWHDAPLFLQHRLLEYRKDNQEANYVIMCRPRAA